MRDGVEITKVFLWFMEEQGKGKERDCRNWVSIVSYFTSGCIHHDYKCYLSYSLTIRSQVSYDQNVAS